PVIAHHRVRATGVAAARLFRKFPIRPRPSVAEVGRGYASLSEAAARTAFVHTLRSVVEPGGQRVSASDRFYLTEGLPTLIVWGALDTVIPVSHAHESHAAMPGSELEIFEQSRHFPHMDEPTRFSRVLARFLADTEPGRIDRSVLRDRIAARSRLGADLAAGNAAEAAPEPHAKAQ
ncbi:MAG: hypothetical protein WAU06_01815, partial [Candidatus Nanopelagicales bacterium]